MLSYLKPQFKSIILMSLLSLISINNDAFAQSIPDDPNIRSNIIPKPSKEPIVPVGDRETITDIVVQYVDSEGNLVEGKTKPNIITQEFELEVGDIYSADLAEEGLERVLDLVIVDRASLYLKKTANSEGAIMAIAIRENNFDFGFGLTLPPPTALQGSVRPVTVNALSDNAGGIGGGIQFELLNLGGNNQGVSLGVEGGVQTLGFNLGYRNFLRHDRGFGVNLFNRRGIESEFDDGDPDIDLDNGSDPWVHRFGGGIEYFAPLDSNWLSAVGISYRRVSVRDGAFSSKIESRDGLGNRLTKSEGGQDDLLTLNFTTVLNRQDNLIDPTRGYRFQFGSDQYIPVGEASILANRLTANYTHYFPVPLFGFTQGAKTLVLNLQGGTILGDAVPYESFILGGSSSVRGYDASEVSTSRSFVQATAEYRYPIAALRVLKNQIDLGGTLFVDYGNDLGSADAVIGQPAVVRDRSGSGLGYGLGLRAVTPIGALRAEFALNDEGDTAFIFKLGDRF